VTLLFTGIEGGARLREADRDAMAAVSTRHDRIVREQVEACGGHVFKATGEAHRAVFADPVAALLSAVAIQRIAGAGPGASSLPIQVCMALPSGACAERNGDYAGPVVNRAARLLDIGHGGQVLVTAAAYALLADRLPDGIGLRDLGEQRLRDLGRAERVFQVTGPGLRAGPDRHDTPVAHRDYYRSLVETGATQLAAGSSGSATCAATAARSSRRLARCPDACEPTCERALALAASCHLLNNFGLWLTLQRGVAPER
jgi:class 3 adenylate cyclase